MLWHCHGIWFISHLEPMYHLYIQGLEIIYSAYHIYLNTLISKQMWKQEMSLKKDRASHCIICDLPAQRILQSTIINTYLYYWHSLMQKTQGHKTWYPQKNTAVYYHKCLLILCHTVWCKTPSNKKTWYPRINCIMYVCMFNIRVKLNY